MYRWLRYKNKGNMTFYKVRSKLLIIYFSHTHINQWVKSTHIFLRNELFCRGRMPLSVLFPRNLEFDKTKKSFIPNMIAYHQMDNI
jgi:hypothetical protein